MARAVIPVKTSNRTPAQAAITFTAADGVNLNSFNAEGQGGKLLLLMKNDSGGPHIVTIKRPVSVDGTAIGDVDVTVAAGAVSVFGPFPEEIYNQADAGNSLTDAVLVDPPATPTSLSFAVLKVGSL